MLIRIHICLLPNAIICSPTYDPTNFRPKFDILHKHLAYIHTSRKVVKRRKDDSIMQTARLCTNRVAKFSRNCQIFRRQENLNIQIMRKLNILKIEF